MNGWLSEQLAVLLDPARSGPIVVLDPDELIGPGDRAELEQEIDIWTADDWVAMRRAWDLGIRVGQGDVDHAAVIVQSSDFANTQDLPWDIEHEAVGVVRVRWPVPLELRALFRAVPDLADPLATAARSGDDISTIVAKAIGFTRGDPASELDTVAKLRTNPSTPLEVWDALGNAFQAELPRSIAKAHGDLMPLQDAWDDWLQDGGRSMHADELSAAPAPIIALLTSGMVASAPSRADDLPAWTVIGASAPDPAVQLDSLLAQQPPAPDSLSGWIETASWWGQVRDTATDLLDPASEDRVWGVWTELDAAFSTWLFRSYGSSLLASANTPRALHQIAPFLARRVEGGARVLLIVVDGLGFAHWARVRATAGLHVLDSTGCLAMIPTLTTISRQAIFAGCLPVEFADSINTTSAEPRRWMQFWKDCGVHERDITYTKLVGATSAEHPMLSGRVVAVVVNAVDEIMHGSEVLGDRQVTASVELWARSGFLGQLVGDATSSGYEVWLTADHGNLPTTPRQVPREGQTVESAGTRVRLYPNSVLRSQAQDHGVIWDPPALPAGAIHPLFAPGRSGYHPTGVRVSHGGLSLDEVIVPFVQVAT